LHFILEFAINYRVAELLEKLRVKFTKSRPVIPTTTPWPSQKMQLVVREYLGYSHIPETLRQPGESLLCRQPEPFRELPSPLLLSADSHR
jgi:hypothetical protein